MATAYSFQTKETSNETTSKDNVSVSSIQQDSIIPLECEAPIDPSWLKRAKEQVVTRKTLEEPTVRVAYLIPSNRSPQEKGVEALQFIIRTGRDFFKDHMEYNGLDPKTFHYETEADGETPLIHVVNIAETDEQIRDEDQGKAWSNTINAAQKAGLSFWQRGEIWLLVAETHLQRPDGSLSAEIALGASSGSADDPGVAILGSTKLTPIAQGAIKDNGAYDSMIIPEIGPYPLRQNVSFPWFEGTTLSSIASSTVGAFVHELGHAMGLGHHDNRNDRNFHGNLMGNGFRGIRGHFYPDKYPEDYTRLAFSSALALSTNHYFNTGMQRNQVDEVTFSLQSATPQDGNLIFNFTAYDADGLSMLQLFGIPDLSVEQGLYGLNYFNGQIKTPYFVPGTQTNFILKLYDKQGNKTERSIMVTPTAGSNRAPWPFLQIRPAIGESGDSFQLDASLSRDPENNNPLTFEWDYNFDGKFDTDPTMAPSFVLRPHGGSYLVRARVTDSQGAQTVSTPVVLHVKGDPPPPTNISFTLINASTNEAIPGFDPIPEEAELNLLHLPAELNIRANVPDGLNSVRFDLDGNKNFRVENLAPFALFGDHEGDYFAGELTLGTHIITAIAGLSNTTSLRFTVTNISTNFILVDADTDEDLFRIEDSMVIDQFTIINKKLNIRTNHNLPLDGLSVRFSIDSFDGTFSRIWTEHVFPYSIFGDIKGDYNGAQLPAGKYHILAVFDYGDDPGFEVEPSVELNFEIRAMAISGFAIHSSPFIHEPTEFSDSGRVFSSIDLPFSTNVAITALTSSMVGSVEIGISGPITHSRIENVNPYSLFGDVHRDFNSRLFPEGDYQLTATPYSQADGQGIAGKSLTVSFRVEMHFGTGYIALIDVDSGNEIGNLFDLFDGNTIDINESPTNNATIVVAYEQCDFVCPGSVFMQLGGPISTSRIENVRPYSLFGDIDGTLFGRDIPVGNYTLAITPYSGSNRTGTVSETVLREFEIIDSNILSPLAKNTVLYPNPANHMALVKTEGNTSAFRTVILDISGKKVKEYSKSINSEQSIDVSGLKKGIYFVQIYSGKAIETKKLVVQ